MLSAAKRKLKETVKEYTASQIDFQALGPRCAVSPDPVHRKMFISFREKWTRKDGLAFCGCGARKVEMICCEIPFRIKSANEIARTREAEKFPNQTPECFC